MFHVCKKWQNILNDLIFYLKCFFVFFLQGRKLTPIQEYIEKLIFNDLSSHNTEKVLKQIRRLHWNDDPEEAAFVVKTLGSVWNYKFNNIRYILPNYLLLTNFNKFEYFKNIIRTFFWD